MRIYVCFKVVPDLEKIIPSDWREFDTIPDTSYVGMQINCLDECGLEMALRLKDNDPTIQCTAVTLGYLSPLIARKIYAAGFDEVICLQCEDREFAPCEVAEELARYIKEKTPDILITGAQAACMDSGIVPIYLAQKLYIPIVTQVTKCSLIEKRLYVTQDTEYGICETEVITPIVLSMANSQVTTLRMATFKEQMKAGKKEIITQEIENLKPHRYKLMPQVPKKCIFIEGTVQEKALFLRQAIQRGD